ncbi:FG-GAP-like repeat-containing protein [Hymenobacter negativus]|uniref:VCBS repeat-containing protein n=1 Tax=Hymenobacter negativus TaxID=2795026 RepID=A0ABS3QBY7_9BACT|nr:FG-GAP-like repeat-containing protein [Hymenobacter negativus]MBO2008631.1 VCBS repeat-containing protein [Hymenobacter negativus]
MLNFSSRLAGAACGLLLSGAFVSALAQAPTITSISPAANARNVPRNASLVATFSQPLTAASAGALKVFSQQRGGLRGAGTAAVAGSTLTFAPSAYDFRPGETVSYTVTSGAASAGGALATPRVGQFVAAVGGPGRGLYGGGFGLTLGAQPAALAVGDLNGDAVPDMVTANPISNTVSVRLSVRYTVYAAEVNVTVGQSPRGVALADVDGDGDLDLLAANALPSTVSVRFNNGLGSFSGVQDVGTDFGPTGLAVGDLDGDGDLDVLAAASGGGNGNTVSCLLNNGVGLFTAAPALTTGVNPVAIALGDVDNDGDLDVTTACSGSGAVTVHLNDGHAAFTYAQSTGTGNNTSIIALVDVNSDGFLDMAMLNPASGTTSIGTVGIILNNGMGAFQNSASFPIGVSPLAMSVGDVDHDGDPDLLVGDQSGRLNVWQNNGAGIFNSTGMAAINRAPREMVMVDMDGDSDLDCVIADLNLSLNTYLNDGTGPLATAPSTALTALTAYPNPATGRVHLSLPLAATRADLCDALGRTVRTVPAQVGTATLDVTGLAPGLYHLRVQADSEQANGVLMVE